MKPSERIKEIADKIAGEWPNDTRHWVKGIIQYLDEQYEKTNPNCFCKGVGCSKNEHTYKVEEK